MAQSALGLGTKHDSPFWTTLVLKVKNISIDKSSWGIGISASFPDYDEILTEQYI